MSAERSLALHATGAPVDAMARALQALAETDRPVLADFDHTLFAANSTELFLASARPACIAAILLWLIRGVPPWRRYPHWVRLRDRLAVAAILLVMPWTLLAWRQAAPALLRKHTGHQLARALALVPAGRITIVSFGLALLIRPLLRGSVWQSCRLVAAGMGRWDDLASGKAALLRRAMPQADYGRAVFITDSEDDRDLLDRVAVPCLVPRQGAAIPAEARLYLPWRYTSLGKYPGKFLDQALGVDLALVFLSTRVLWAGSPLLICGALLLHISLFAIYEIGYFENDFLAAAHEAAPTLAPGSEMFRGFPLERHAWAWGLCLGVAGCWAVGQASATSGWQICGLSAIWAAVLLATRLVFAVYNRRDESWRLFLYPLLQAAKSFGVLAILPPLTLGVALLSAQAMTMWMNYAIYRLGGRKQDFHREYIRLAAFLTFGTGIVLADPAAFTQAGPLWIGVMLGWAGWRVWGGRVRVALLRTAARLCKRPVVRA